MIALLGGRTEGNLALLEGLRALGFDIVLGPARELRPRLRPGDVAINRLDVLPTLDGVEPGLLDVLWLERGGVRVVNSVRALLAAHDKLRSSLALAKAGIRQPRFVHVRTREELRRLEPPVVVKPRFGSWGHDVMKCADRQELAACSDVVVTRSWFRRHGALVQELLPPPRRDLRALVAAGRVVGSAARTAAPGEWRTNVSLGGSLEPAELPEETSGLAAAAARALGADLVGVDLLPAPGGGWVVLELNAAADFDARYSLPGRDVIADIANALHLGEPARAGHARIR